ncbi:MAG: hypothetical protein E7370_06380 [Clostridiales bacterium]|nr:hypothetical protein [Clostridiales bacterium]
MLNNLLDIIPNPDGNWYFESHIEALIYALIGISIIFVGIVIIIGIIWLVGFLMKKTNNFAFLTGEKPKKDKVEKVEEVKATQIIEEEIPDQVKVAIIAAIMAYYQQEKPKCEFTVKKIKRI